MASAFTPLLCVVDFHHARGPEIEQWHGSAGDPVKSNPDWHLIPYMALPDGAHANAEEFSYFTLVHNDPTGSSEPTSVFGISCCQQIDANELKWKSSDVTRSAVQKAVCVITARPWELGGLREKLRVVTRAWFAQKDFRDGEILERFQESLAKEHSGGLEDERDQAFGLSLRELVHKFKWQTLVLFKCLLLQPKILLFGSHCERVCQVQFSLLALIPGLARALRDCADPQMNRYAETLRKPDSVKTSDRSSMLAYVGLPLQIFGEGAVFGPYTPLQQLDTLTDQGTKSYVVGSTNSLLLQQRERYCDVLINLDDNSVNISSPSLRSALALTVADRRWMDFLTQQVNDTWDELDPSRPTTHGYAGSEEFIRLQFEEYIIALLSATKYHQYLSTHTTNDPKALLGNVEGDPSTEFSAIFVEAWQQTQNYTLWNRTTDDSLFDICEPRHPMAGGLTIEDVQRRLAQQVSDLHLDERFSGAREVVGKRLADGQVRVSSAFNKVWADIEVMREAQRKRTEEARAAAEEAKTANGGTDTPTSPSAHTASITAASRFQKPDLTQAQASVSAASQRAGAYLSSWGAWASEKRKTGWGGGASKGAASPSTTTSATASPRESMAGRQGGLGGRLSGEGRESVDFAPVDLDAQRPRVTTVSELEKEEGRAGTGKSEETAGPTKEAEAGAEAKEAGDASREGDATGKGDD